MKISNSRTFGREFMDGENGHKKYYESTSERNGNISGKPLSKLSKTFY